MDTPGGVIEGDGIRIESSEETAEQMIAAVTPKKDEPTKFKAVVEGEKPEKEKTGISKAASDLGKRGGKAAAKARAAQTEETSEEPEEKAPAKPKTPSGESDEPEEKEEDTDPEVRKSRAAERVKAATREAAEAKRERDRLKAENEELRRARQAPPDREERPEPPKAPQKPKADDFENYEDYLDARDVHNRQMWEAEHAEKESARQEREQVIGMVKTFQGAVKEAVAEDPKFWDKVPEIHDSTPLGREIVQSGGNAPAILRYLSEHSEEHNRISEAERRSGPMVQEIFSYLQKYPGLREVIREVGKIEARLEDATAGNPSSDEHPGPNPEISRARPPARPVAASPHIASGDTSKEPDEEAPLSAFVADFRKRKAAASGR